MANTGVGGSEAQVYYLTLSDDATIGTTGNKLNIYGTLNGGGHVLTVAGTGEINIRPNNGFVNLAGVTVNSGLFRLESSQNWAGPYTVNAGGKLDTYGTSRTKAGNVNLNGGLDMHLPVLVLDPVPLRLEAAVDHRAEAGRLFPQFPDSRLFPERPAALTHTKNRTPSCGGFRARNGFFTVSGR